jgi:hypothetical protein
MIARGERHGRYTKPWRTARGEGHGRAKLTEQDVIEVRALRRRGETITALAQRFEVDRRTIRFAVTHTTWAHVE